MPRKDPRPTTRERAEAARDLLEALAEEDGLEGHRLDQAVRHPEELVEQASHDLWEAGLVSYRLRTRSGTARTLVELTPKGRSQAAGT